MKKIALLLIVLLMLSVGVSAAETIAPPLFETLGQAM